MHCKESPTNKKDEEMLRLCQVYVKIRCCITKTRRTSVVIAVFAKSNALKATSPNRFQRSNACTRPAKKERSRRVRFQ